MSFSLKVIFATALPSTVYKVTSKTKISLYEIIFRIKYAFDELNMLLT